MAKPAAKSTKKKARNPVVDGIAFIHASFNNTIITIADREVEVGADRFRFQTLGAAHDNAAHDAGIGGSGRQHRGGS